MRLCLDEATHTYRLDGRPIRSVTQILNDAGIVDTTYFTPEAALRGKYVHEATQYHDEGTLDPSTVDPAIQPYLQGWIQFRALTGFKPALIEAKIWHSCGYAGTLDRAGWLNGRFVLLDIKSGAVAAWTALQTSGYEHGLVERIKAGDIDCPMPQGRLAVQVTRQGKFKVVPFEDFRDRDVFLAAHQVSQWRMAA